jgi:tRNA(Ile)-lysidine synthase
MTTRARLTPAIADVRYAVRAALAAPGPRSAGGAGEDTVLVALSGGADSLALAGATAFEAARAASGRGP